MRHTISISMSNLRLAIWTFALVWSGCGGSFHVGSAVPIAPTLPVRVFPELAIVHGTEPDDFDLAAALARHLALSSADARIEHLDRETLDRRRVQGLLGPASAVLRVETRVVETTRTSFATEPETVCTSSSCQTHRRTTLRDVPVVIATLFLQVSEGRSGRVLQEVRIRERDEGLDVFSMRLRVLDRLRQQAIGSIDIGQRELRIELLDSSDAQVRSALQAIRDGQIGHGCAVLERVVSHPNFRRRTPREQARILFDLGQTRRLALRNLPVSESDDERLDAARDALQRALGIHPEAEFARAIDQLEEERSARFRMRAHAEATAHNFRIDRERTAPAPPPGYRDPSTPFAENPPFELNSETPFRLVAEPARRP